MTALDVYLHEDRAGTLERLDGAKLRFTYDPEWLATAAMPLSLSLSLREEPYADADCRPFFAGLLPEGEFLKAIARAFGISAENPFSVLREIGGECAGAVSLVEAGATPPFFSSPAPRWLSEAELASLLEELLTHPLMAGEDDDEGIRLSLAGTRDKLGVLLKDGRIGITGARPCSWSATTGFEGDRGCGGFIRRISARPRLGRPRRSTSRKEDPASPSVRR
jgi:serine/threonine-protein kinase HipA